MLLLKTTLGVLLGLLLLVRAGVRTMQGECGVGRDVGRHLHSGLVAPATGDVLHKQLDNLMHAFASLC